MPNTKNGECPNSQCRFFACTENYCHLIHQEEVYGMEKSLSCAYCIRTLRGKYKTVEDLHQGRLTFCSDKCIRDFYKPLPGLKLPDTEGE
jgi:hypothetical protein